MLNGASCRTSSSTQLQRRQPDTTPSTFPSLLTLFCSPYLIHSFTETQALNCLRHFQAGTYVLAINRGGRLAFFFPSTHPRSRINTLSSVLREATRRLAHPPFRPFVWYPFKMSPQWSYVDSNHLSGASYWHVVQTTYTTTFYNKSKLSIFA